MKRKLIIAGALMFTLATFAQKDELKALKKLDQLQTQPTAAQLKEYKDLFAAFESKIGNATDEQKNDFYYYRGTYYLFVDAMLNPANALNAISKGMEDVNKVLEYEKNGKKKYTDELTQQSLPMLKQQIAAVAGQLVQQKMFKEASAAYALAYKIDPKDGNNLYNAAASAVNGQDYDSALKYYLELEKIGFTGEATIYLAKNIASGQFEAFPDKKTRDLGIQQKVFVEPKEEKLPSVKGEIIKNIALIYIQKGETEKAKQAVANARKTFPDDVSLLLSEAELYLKTNDMEMYKKLINEATLKNPNNADLFYNLGVVTASTDKNEAIKFYKKALEINPNHVKANLNMGVITIEDEKKIVEEMNSLGTSAKDNKRFDELKKQREVLYKKALPYFQNVVKTDPDNQDAITTMANIYQALDMQAEAKAMKARLK